MESRRRVRTNRPRAILVEFAYYCQPRLATTWNPLTDPPPVSPLNPSDMEDRVIFLVTFFPTVFPCLKLSGGLHGTPRGLRTALNSHLRHSLVTFNSTSRAPGRSLCSPGHPPCLLQSFCLEHLSLPNFCFLRGFAVSSSCPFSAPTCPHLSPHHYSLLHLHWTLVSLREGLASCSTKWHPPPSPQSPT